MGDNRYRRLLSDDTALGRRARRRIIRRIREEHERLFRSLDPLLQEKLAQAGYTQKSVRFPPSVKEDPGVVAWASVPSVLWVQGKNKMGPVTKVPQAHLYFYVRRPPSYVRRVLGHEIAHQMIEMGSRDWLQSEVYGGGRPVLLHHTNVQDVLERGLTRQLPTIASQVESLYAKEQDRERKTRLRELLRWLRRTERTPVPVPRPTPSTPIPVATPRPRKR